jgi:hypothetical protein
LLPEGFFLQRLSPELRRGCKQEKKKNARRDEARQGAQSKAKNPWEKKSSGNIAHEDAVTARTCHKFTLRVHTQASTPSIQKQYTSKFETSQIFSSLTYFIKQY